jgi:hypothetical protein
MRRGAAHGLHQIRRRQPELRGEACIHSIHIHNRDQFDILPRKWLAYCARVRVGSRAVLVATSAARQLIARFVTEILRREVR